MADKTKIEWSDATWTPLRARYSQTQNDGSGKERIGWHCEHVSEGCRNCYAEGINRRLGTGRDFKPGALRNGEVKAFLDEDMLYKPHSWLRPRMIFVCSMTDMFGDWVTDGQIMRMLWVMGTTQKHTYQILTKRSARMRNFFARWADVHDSDFCEFKNARGPDEVRKAHSSGRAMLFAEMLETMGKPPAGAAWPTFDWAGGMVHWPDVLPNVWLGVSAEDQKRADERRPDLKALSETGWTTFVSYEPALGPVDWTGWEFLDQLISGGESGPHARVHHPDWHRAARDWAADADVAYHFKQWGEWAPKSHLPIESTGQRAIIDNTLMLRVGKKAAGRTLDGVIHDAFPEASR